MKKKQASLSHDTEIDVFAKKDGVIKKKTMTYGEFLNTKLVKGWSYDLYQKGFSSIKETE